MRDSAWFASLFLGHICDQILLLVHQRERPWRVHYLQAMLFGKTVLFIFSIRCHLWPKKKRASQRHLTCVFHATIGQPRQARRRRTAPIAGSSTLPTDRRMNSGRVLFAKSTRGTRQSPLSMEKRFVLAGRSATEYQSSKEAHAVIPSTKWRYVLAKSNALGATPQQGAKSQGTSQRQVPPRPSIPSNRERPKHALVSR